MATRHTGAVLDSLTQDLKFVFRTLASDRWFSATVIGVLALGIGANTLGFTIVNAAFFRGLPFEQSAQLHMVTWINQQRPPRRSAADRAGRVALAEPRVRGTGRLRRHQRQPERRPRAARSGARDAGDDEYVCDPAAAAGPWPRFRRGGRVARPASRS